MLYEYMAEQVLDSYRAILNCKCRLAIPYESCLPEREAIVKIDFA